MKTATYQELKRRLQENRTLSKGGVGQWEELRLVAGWLAVNPWRLIGPVAVIVALGAWWIWGTKLTVIILRIFGGA